MKYLFLNNIKSVVYKNSFFIIVLLLYILFHSFFETLFEKLFVSTFLCHLETSLINDLIVGGLLIYIVFRLIINLRNNFFISNKTIIVSILMLGVCIYYRLFDDLWIFTATRMSFNFKYFDLVIFFLISNVIIRLFYKEKKLTVRKEFGFCYDNPNRDPKKALKNRIVIAEKIADTIKNTSDSNSSFAIGITSEWGRGKTSFISLIESKIKDSEKRIIVQFNPWLNNDERSLIKSFFDELSIPLKKYNRELSNDLLRYAELLSEIDTSRATKMLNGFGNFFLNQNDDLRSRFESINSAIKSSGLQIIISIDDLDRLFEKEIVEVLRLIRNSANFTNTIFIVAYDRNYLVSSLKKANSYKPGFYLEKIFQLEIALPPFERSVIIERLKELFLDRLLPEDQKVFRDLLISKNGLFDSPSFRHDLITNLRDVNRLANSFFISYEALKGEIVLADLLNVELLRSKYLGVYNLFAFDYQSFLTYSRGQSTDLIDVTYLRLDKENDDNGNESNVLKLEKFLKSHPVDVGIQKNQITDVINYVCAVFPFHNQYVRIKSSLVSITNPTSIDRYFQYNLLGSNLSEVEFSRYRQGTEAAFLLKISEWVECGLEKEVFSRLERIVFFSNKEDYEKIIKSIFHYAAIKKDANKGHLSFDNSNLIKKLKYENVAHFYNESEFNEFVKSVIVNQDPPFIFVSEFINSVLTECQFSHNNLNFIVDKEWLLKQKLVFLEQYTKSIERFDIYVFWLYNDSNYFHWEEINNTNQIIKKTIEPTEAKELFRSCAERLIESFLKFTIKKDFQFYHEKIDVYCVSNIIKNVWGSWDIFESFLDNLDDANVMGLKEYRHFYSKCKATNFESYIKFRFSEIDLSEDLA